MDMLQAMGTGHDGSLSTGHANGAEEMMLRLETMVLMAVDMPIDAVRNQIAAGIDIVVHLGRMRDGSRKVIKIAEIKGRDAKGNIRLNTLYEYVTEEVDEDGRVIGELKRTKNEFIHKDKLLAAGT